MTAAPADAPVGRPTGGDGGWSFRQRGAEVRMAVPPGDGTLAAAVAETLAPAVASGPAAAAATDGTAAAVVVTPQHQGWRIERWGRPVWSGGDRAELVRRAASEVHLVLAATAPADVFVHAGCVVWQGAGIVVPGRSGTGKTTLVRELVRLGADYFSDEYAVLDADGRAHACPRPLGIPTEPGRPGSCRVVAVVHTEHRRGATWHPREATGAAVVPPLVDNAVAARLAPERVLAHTAAVAHGGATLLSGPRGEATATARMLLDRVVALSGRPGDRDGRR